MVEPYYLTIELGLVCSGVKVLSDDYLEDFFEDASHKLDPIFGLKRLWLFIH